MGVDKIGIPRIGMEWKCFIFRGKCGVDMDGLLEGFYLYRKSGEDCDVMQRLVACD